MLKARSRKTIKTADREYKFLLPFFIFLGKSGMTEQFLSGCKVGIVALCFKPSFYQKNGVCFRLNASLVIVADCLLNLTEVFWIFCKMITESLALHTNIWYDKKA